ncbi:MAG: hypothetical protein IPP17_13320 [Bacteroidetes bacterium]|nr:hypothetical protein [Bacteroidota bacterium]
MKKKFTDNDVLRFLYGEMSPSEHDAFLDAMYEDEELFEKFEELKAAQAGLQPVELTPSEASVSRVMSYAKRAVRNPRPKRTKLAYNGSGSMFAFNQIVTIVMIVFTCVTVGIATFVYSRASKPENSWTMTPTHEEFLDHELDDRLDLARERLNNILDSKRETLVPVHHDTYRVVTSDLFAPQDENVVFLHVK